MSRNAEVQAPIARASDRIAARGSHLSLGELAPAEDGVGAQGIEPGEQPDVVARFP